jgi:hypothetical protein
MEKRCPHCGLGIREAWHQRYGIQKLDKGWAEAGIPFVGRVKFQREILVMVYICGRTNLPFLVALKKTR